MIRVIYQWQVPPENLSAFQQAWKQTTTSIHETVSGARGSFLLQDHADPGKILTIARWDSREDWQAFYEAENPPQMLRMRELGERVSVTSYDEFEDVTV